MHYKGEFSADLTVYSFEELVFKEHKISLGRQDINRDLLIYSHAAPTLPVNPNYSPEVRVTSVFTTSISYFIVSWLRTSVGLFPTDHDLLHETQEI